MSAILTSHDGLQQQGRSHSPGGLSPSVGRERARSPFLPRHSSTLQTVPSQISITSPTRELSLQSFPFTDDREIPGFYVVIPAGGAGTRLWPLSRENHPKFLLDVNLCGSSLLQSTWDRLLPLAGPSRMTVVAGPAHSDGILGQLPNLAASNLFTEPGPKDSMAAIGLAAAILVKRDPDAVIGSFAADHMISGEDAFLSAVAEAVEVAKEGYLVTIGIAPSHPATGFGYIRLGDRLNLKSAPHSRLVSSFKEKPDAHTAAKYLATGQYRWNAGMFVTKASLLMELMKENCPSLYEGLMNISDVWEDEAARKVALEEVWPMLEKIPIDNAVAEPAAAEGKVAVIPATFGKKLGIIHLKTSFLLTRMNSGWDDVGDFSSLAEMLPAESNKPRVLGDARLGKNPHFTHTDEFYTNSNIQSSPSKPLEESSSPSPAASSPFSESTTSSLSMPPMRSWSPPAHVPRKSSRWLRSAAKLAGRTCCNFVFRVLFTKMYIFSEAFFLLL
jgi:mannose-1-phosphate guanylyltransferase